MITVLSVALGITLGTRFKVLCLVPVMAIGIAILAVRGHANMISFSSTLWSVVALSIGLQVGYFIGAMARASLLAVLTSTATGLKPLRGRPARIS